MAQGKASSKVEITVQERQLKVLDLRKLSLSYREIAKQLDISHTQARDDYRAAMDDLKAVENESAEEMRLMELIRLDQLQKVVWAKALKGDMFAVDRALRISESRRKLLGLDKPAQLDINARVIGPDFTEQQLTVIKALQPYPEARAAVAAALMALNPIEGELGESSTNASND